MFAHRLSVKPRWIDRSAIAVVAGDLVAIGAFLSYGLTTHGIGPLQFPRHTVLISLPFVLSWLLLASIGGLYRPETRGSVRATLVRMLVVWPGVCLLGGALRSTPYLPGGAPPEFLLVMVVFGAAFVLPWRLGLALTEHVRHNYHGEIGRIGDP